MARRLSIGIVCMLALGPSTPACAASRAASIQVYAAAGGGSARGHSTASTDPNTPVPVARSDVPPVGRRLSSNRVLAITDRLPKLRAVRASHPGSYGGAYLKGPGRWQVSYFSRKRDEIGQAIISDSSGRVLEQWTGFQIAWSMARGYPGAFGRHVDALYVWLPLCLLFFLPFLDWRKPLRLLHLDLLVLLSFSISLAFFNHADVGVSTPLVYPPLLYLLVRMLVLCRRPRRPAPSLRLIVPAPWLAVGVVFLLAFRVALNVTDSNVIDVGYAGVIGAQRITHDLPLYRHYPSNNERGDTYGPVNYEAYVPFQQIFGWSGGWDDLPAAHAAAIFFDLLATGLLFLLGRRVRGPSLGIALAYAWVSYPFTLFALESNSNDALVGALVLAAMLAAAGLRGRALGDDRRGGAVQWARRASTGALTAFAGLTKFAPFALAPLFATHGLRGLSRRRQAVALGAFGAACVLAGALAGVPALAHDSLHTVLHRTIVYQANRESPFSVWGFYGGLGGAQKAVAVGAVLLALVLAFVPRRSDLVGLAAACAAVLVAVQLAASYWFYLYIPWFFGAAMLALFGALSPPGTPEAEASGSARSSQLAAA